jgi:ArsR family transcriptional regulator, arsenate/arsenite/antimonite-responsive transcriptional repressor / arsenate reductase (thioredoxin)
MYSPEMGRRTVGSEPAPPPFLRLAGHPLRWRLLGELAGSDRQVHELTALLGQPQNLVSYHLGLLRRENLVTARRSNADGRDMYYSVDLARCGHLLAAAGGALHPALRLAPPTLPASAPAAVLFLCTGNSSRSQMAEALLRQMAGPAVRVSSAGSHPKAVHPHTVTVMAERGIDLTGARAKHVDDVTGDRFDHVITLCDRVREVCPDLPGGPAPIHWSIADPAREADGYPAFRRCADELAGRIRFLLHRIATPSSQEAS